METSSLPSSRSCFSRRSDFHEPLKGSWRHVPLEAGVCGAGAYSCVHGNRTAWETNEIDREANARWHARSVSVATHELTPCQPHHRARV